LRALAEEARREGKVMHALTEKATQDAAAVKVITVITMIYLPLTVVANFFSTQFVTQKPVGESHAIKVADNWWTLAAVGLPLKAVTFFMWWAISQQMLLFARAEDEICGAPESTGIEECEQESLAGSTVVIRNVIT
jgi:hypothetical protein